MKEQCVSTFYKKYFTIDVFGATDVFGAIDVFGTNVEEKFRFILMILNLVCKESKDKYDLSSIPSLTTLSSLE